MRILAVTLFLLAGAVTCQPDNECGYSGHAPESFIICCSDGSCGTSGQPPG